MKFLILILILITSLFSGCNYNQVSLNEQIAIYQNLGFVKSSLQSEIAIANTTIKCNTIEEVNNYNESLKVTDAIILYLADDTLMSIIFIYYFLNTKDSTNFYNFFYNSQKDNIYLYKKTVIQKGIDNVSSTGLNTHYYTKFCNTLKK